MRPFLCYACFSGLRPAPVRSLKAAKPPPHTRWLSMAKGIRRGLPHLWGFGQALVFRRFLREVVAVRAVPPVPGIGVVAAAHHVLLDRARSLDQRGSGSLVELDDDLVGHALFPSFTSPVKAPRASRQGSLSVGYLVLFPGFGLHPRDHARETDHLERAEPRVGAHRRVLAEIALATASRSHASAILYASAASSARPAFAARPRRTSRVLSGSPGAGFSEPVF